MGTREKLLGLGIGLVGMIGTGFILYHVFHTAGSANATPPATPTVVRVTIANDPTTVGKYVPAAITVRGNRAESIEIHNTSSSLHTVTDEHGRFNTRVIPVGGKATLRITAPGLYHYHCTLHTRMKGTINVILQRQPRKAA